MAERVASRLTDASHEIANRVHEHEEQINEAAKEVACGALEVYAHGSSQSLAQLIASQAQNQQTSPGGTLVQLDPGAATRLQDAMQGVETSQQAADVIDKLQC